MPISTRCPNCHKRGRSPATYAGRRARCSACYYEFEIISDELIPVAEEASASSRAASGAWGFRASVQKMGARLPRAWR